MGSIHLNNRFTEAEKKEMAGLLKELIANGNIKVMTMKAVGEYLQKDMPAHKHTNLYNRDKINRALGHHLTNATRAELLKAMRPHTSFVRSVTGGSTLNATERTLLADAYIKTDESLNKSQRMQLAIQRALPVEKHRAPSSFYICKWWTVELQNAESRKRLAELKPSYTELSNEDIDAVIKESLPTELQSDSHQAAENTNAASMDGIHARDFRITDEDIKEFNLYGLPPPPLKVSFEDLLAESLANMFVKAAKLALPTVMRLLSGEMQEHLNQPEAPTPNKTEEIYAPRHNPFPNNDSKEKKPNVLIVGLMPSKKQLINEKFGDKFNLRFWGMDQTDSLLQQATESADAAMIMTGYIKHKHTQIVSDRFKKRDANDWVTLVANGPKELEDRLRHLSNRFLQ